MQALNKQVAGPKAFTSQRPARSAVVVRAQAAATTTLNTKRSAEVRREI